MAIKAHDTFWQRRKLHGMEPKLLEVLKVEEVIGTSDICQVRWHILGTDSVSTSDFPMATITEGHFADFVPIPRDEFLKALTILNTTPCANDGYSTLCAQIITPTMSRGVWTKMTDLRHVKYALVNTSVFQAC